MHKHILEKRNKAARRARRVRIRLHGTKERPRLSVFRSAKYISAQFIDDDAGKTLAFASDKGMDAKNKPVERAAVVGKNLADAVKALGISTAVVDRGPYRFHGRVKALVDAVEEAGIVYKTSK